MSIPALKSAVDRGPRLLSCAPAEMVPSVRELGRRLSAVRAATLDLCAPLSAEDAAAQSMPDASPAKWHLAHTTWFFEALVLVESGSYRVFDRGYNRLFNSYYERLGKLYPRHRRGLLTRPSMEEVLRYRQHVDLALATLLEARRLSPPLLQLIELGIQHEQQHQELLLTDIKHLFWRNPLGPVYRERPKAAQSPAAPRILQWLRGAGGEVEIGQEGEGFCFDNELPRHRTLLRPFLVASRPATNREFRGFIDDEGYRRPELWLSDGWKTVQRRKWRRPLYWAADLHSEFTLHGAQPLDPEAAVCHLSYYEANAFARWSQARLPTEQEWEALASPMNEGAGPSLQLQPGRSEGGWYGEVWNWTSSAYAPYPGYRAPAGAVGEYNGKFMCSQLVLRGGSCVSPPGHLRRSYRNFFPPDARWQFSGVRLARDAA